MGVQNAWHGVIDKRFRRPHGGSEFRLLSRPIVGARVGEERRAELSWQYFGVLRDMLPCGLCALLLRLRRCT